MEHKKTIRKILNILTSDLFVNYSHVLPFSDSDESELNHYLINRPSEINHVLEMFEAMRVILENAAAAADAAAEDEDDEDNGSSHVNTDDEIDARLTKCLEDLKLNIKNSELLKWYNESYSLR
jgi:hypothetical protein